MADSLLRFSLVCPPSLRLLPPVSTSTSTSTSLRSGLSRRLGLLESSSHSRHWQSKRLSNLKVHAAVSDNEGPKWWEKGAGPNMIDVHSTEEILDILSQAGDKLVVVEFYGTWCGSCRALFPKICKTAQANPDILFVKVDFDENKSLCKRLNVRVLPYFQFYRGTELLESFSCSLAKFQKIKDAIATHNTARSRNSPSLGAGYLNLSDTSVPQKKPAEHTSPNVGR